VELHFYFSNSVIVFCNNFIDIQLAEQFQQCVADIQLRYMKAMEMKLRKIYAA
jgi:hypothetical protein